MPGPNTLDVACPKCDAVVGEDCTTPSGRAARWPHRPRRDDLKLLLSGDNMVIEVLKDDEPLGIKAGEQYLAKTYWLDPGAKVSLLARLPDGHDPSCNQYWHTVKFSRWATAKESEALSA